MKCFGYYIVKPMPKPKWCTLNTNRILTISEGDLSYKFPDLTKCFWINYPQSDREQYAEYLGLNSDEFLEFCQLVKDLFDLHRISTDGRLRYLEDAFKLSTYIRNNEEYRIVGLYTDGEVFLKFEKEGYFNVVESGNDSNDGKCLGCEILGSEMLGDGYFGFFSYIENSLNEVLDKNVSLLIDNQTGLILNTYEETKQFSNMIQGMGEPVIWTPFMLCEFDGE